MKFYRLILSGLLIAALLGCKNNVGGSSPEEAEYNNLYNEVMGVHDEIMPQMQNISRLHTDMTNVLDNLKASNQTNKLPEANAILGQLNKSQDAMMTWMNDFSELEDIDGMENKMMFLEKEKVAINHIKTLFEESIRKAENYVKEQEIQ